MIESIKKYNSNLRSAQDVSMQEKIKITSVIVTYNRLELLKKCVDSVRNQSLKVNEIIVVDNSSSDGTNEWLNEQNDLIIISQLNSGSAGGQYSGIKKAFERGCDWIWCLDADVIPEKDALVNLLIDEIIFSHKIGFISSTIYSPDGNLAYANIPELVNSYDLLNSIVKSDFVPILTASFGSIIIKRDVIKIVGLPSKDFFIWGDDAEFTFRMISNNYLGFMSLKSKAVHFQNNNPTPFKNLNHNDFKLKYGIRNMVYVNILRNKIVNKSLFRGWLSGLAFIIRVYKQRKENSNFNFIKEIVQLSYGFLRGITFKPRIEIPNET